MINQAIGSLAGLAFAAALFAVTPARAADWVPIKGKVRLADGTPICAMVLANGQYVFSCGGDGAYRLNVPLDNKGQVTLFAFADGFAPFRVTAGPKRLPSNVRTRTAAPGSPLISMTRAVECSSEPDWVRIRGKVQSSQGQPLCAMVLANGQHTFSCDASQGRYDLKVPTDQNGEVTLFGFADGFQPYSETFSGSACDGVAGEDLPMVSSRGDFALAVATDGTVWAWGNGSLGRLGNGESGGSRPTAVQVQGLKEVVSVDAGPDHSLAVLSNGGVWAWGGNSFDQLGIPEEPYFDADSPYAELNRIMTREPPTISETPLKVAGLQDVVSVTAARGYSAAIKSDGTVWVWGCYAPAVTEGCPREPVKIDELDGVMALAQGADHTLALRSDGRVWAWGDNVYGQLGSGNYQTISTWVQVRGLRDVVAIAAGSTHSLALRSDGTVSAWGSGGSGQLGDGRKVSSPTPVRVARLPHVSAVDAKDDLSLALATDGTVWEWGLNDGRLGYPQRSFPEPVAELTNVVDITLGDSFGLALRSDGTVWGWGMSMDDIFGLDAAWLQFPPEQVRGVPDLTR